MCVCVRVCVCVLGSPWPYVRCPSCEPNINCPGWGKCKWDSLNVGNCTDASVPVGRRGAVSSQIIHTSSGLPQASPPSPWYQRQRACVNAGARVLAGKKWCEVIIPRGGGSFPRSAIEPAPWSCRRRESAQDINHTGARVWSRQIKAGWTRGGSCEEENVWACMNCMHCLNVETYPSEQPSVPRRVWVWMGSVPAANQGGEVPWTTHCLNHTKWWGLSVPLELSNVFEYLLKVRCHGEAIQCVCPKRGILMPSATWNHEHYMVLFNMKCSLRSHHEKMLALCQEVTSKQGALCFFADIQLLVQ